MQQELDVHKIELELQNEELRSARESTEDALARYLEVFEFAPIGFATLNAAGEIQEINHAGAKLLGLERALLTGKRFGVWVAADSLPVFNNFLAAAATRTAQCEITLRGASMELYARLTGAMIRIRGWILVAFEDVTETKQHELALREANRRKDDFLGMLSHELRNPLAPITMCVAILKKIVPASEPVTDAIDILGRSTAHLNQLVGDLLDATKILHGKLELRRRDVELTALLEHTIRELRATCKHRGIRIETRLAAGEHWVDGDEKRLVQVFTKLLSNAAKFSPNNARIQVTLDRSSTAVVVRVIDSGIGIERELLETLFEPFVQGAQGIDRSSGGLGLGLAMVKGLVELHGGHVALSSDGRGRGAQASVQLPAIPRPQRPASQPVVVKASPRRVLIIEDQREVAESLAHALRLSGHDIEVALDGTTGIERARIMRPDVVFCDLGLPDVDGYFVASNLRSSKEHPNICLVALTGYARPQDVARAAEAGFHHHLAKPARLDEIEALLAELG